MERRPEKGVVRTRKSGGSFDGFCSAGRREKGLIFHRDRGNHERLLPRGLAGSCHHFRWFLTGNEYEDGSERCWSVVLLLLKRSMEGNGSKQTHLWCWYDAVG
ncbi:uncharacterized protein LOC128126658 isoform X4 [Lactuca sativa]|uniref:uncharacterized protein LOC128126658 isoform X4 n=1 Tax=Lactuca sativa TaxID=4236 RepID=UPI0022B0177F|nr:uncharacterized protein LOC128126658 isoform X4 [Lactuca sativa]